MNIIYFDITCPIFAFVEMWDHDVRSDTKIFGKKLLIDILRNFTIEEGAGFHKDGIMGSRKSICNSTFERVMSCQ